MYFLIPAIIVCFIQCYLLFSWYKSRQRGDGKEKMICLLGFLLGQIYLLWEVALVKVSGKPLPGSAEQKMLMLRLLLGASIGGLFTIMGLFYLSFAQSEQLKKLGQKDKS